MLHTTGRCPAALTWAVRLWREWRFSDKGSLYMLKAVAVLPAGKLSVGAQPAGTAVLAHDERHLRRKAITLSDGSRILVDLPEPVMLSAGDSLVLEDGRHVLIAAAVEDLLEIVPRDPLHLSELAWHIGNRHLPAAIETERILILRDHVIADMLRQLGAELHEIAAPFTPLRGAYSGNGAHQHEGRHYHLHASQT